MRREEVEEGKGGWILVMEGDLTLDDEHIMQYTDDIKLCT